MNKKHLCYEIAVDTGLSRETVETVLDSVEKIVVQLLKSGDQLHWGGFLRAWTVYKSPALPSSKLRYEDTPTSKLRYLLPRCAFGAKVVQNMKKEQFNMASETGQTDERSRR